MRNQRIVVIGGLHKPASDIIFALNKKGFDNIIIADNPSDEWFYNVSECVFGRVVLSKDFYYFFNNLKNIDLIINVIPIADLDLHTFCDDRNIVLLEFCPGFNLGIENFVDLVERILCNK